VEYSQVPQAGPFLPGIFVLKHTGLTRCYLQEEYEGEVVHSLEYTTAKNYIGKKVIVVGAATSGHDVAFDLANHGVGQ
jgi:thioredoxin reductase